MDKTELREKLAELDHEHWEYFTKSATNAALVQRMLPLHDFLKAEWGMYWKPYEDLPEGLKSLYRKWADQFLELLSKWPGLEALDVSSEDKERYKQEESEQQMQSLIPLLVEAIDRIISEDAPGAILAVMTALQIVQKGVCDE